MEEFDDIYEEGLITGEYCSSCKDVPWVEMFRELYQKYKTGEKYGCKPSSYTLHGAASYLQDPECLSECPLCQFIWEAKEVVKRDGQNPFKFVTIDLSTDSDYDIQALPFVHVRFKFEMVEAKKDSVAYEISQTCRLALRNDTKDSSFPHLRPRFTSFELLKSQEIKKYVCNQSLSLNPLSPIMLDTMRAWLKRCDKDHNKCKLIDGDVCLPTTEAPTRLLKIDPDGSKIALLEMSSLRSFPRYAALSHCWGTEQAFTTQSKNLDAHRVGVEIAELPQTFQDSIIVCKQLCIQFLWIDSLCIIQDDTKDWEKESAKMGTVYKNAYLTIAASRASSDMEGFLTHRHLPRAKKGLRPVRFCEPLPGVFLASDYAELYSVLHDSPLSKRAWVIQEKYLSRRSIFFTECGTYWRCCELEAGEHGDLHEPYLNMKDILETLKPDMNTDSGMGSPSEDGILSTDDHSSTTSSYSRRKLAQNEAYDKWYSIVLEYSRCKLTKPSDRLPALSGMAAEIAARTKEKYHAGIWANAMIAGLAWWTEDPRGHNSLAPSWSWASCASPVRFWCVYEIGIRASISNVSVQHKGLNPFGEVNGGSLTLTASTTWGIVYRRTANDSILLFQLQDEWLELSFYYDDSRDSATNELLQMAMLYCMLDTVQDPSSKIRALVLSSNEDGTYRRIGMAVWDYWPFSQLFDEEIFQFSKTLSEEDKQRVRVDSLNDMPKQDFVIV